jgi:hypothetical protein
LGYTIENNKPHHLERTWQVVIGPAAQEKSFPLRSVPESLELAAEESFKSLSGEGGSQHDLMEVAIGGWAR